MISTSVIRKMPNSGMKRAVAAPVCRSSQASSHGDPTRRTLVNGAAGASRGRASESIAASARLRSAGEFTRSSSAMPRIVIAQKSGAAEQRRAGRECAHALGFAGADFPRRAGATVEVEEAVCLDVAESWRVPARAGRRRAATQGPEGSGASSMMSACSPSGNRRSNSEVATRDRIAGYDQPLDRRIVWAPARRRICRPQ